MMQFFETKSRFGFLEAETSKASSMLTESAAADHGVSQRNSFYQMCLKVEKTEVSAMLV